MFGKNQILCTSGTSCGAAIAHQRTSTGRPPHNLPRPHQDAPDPIHAAKERNIGQRVQGVGVRNVQAGRAKKCGRHNGQTLQGRAEGLVNHDLAHLGGFGQPAGSQRRHQKSGLQTNQLDVAVRIRTAGIIFLDPKHALHILRKFVLIVHTVQRAESGVTYIELLLQRPPATVRAKSPAQGSKPARYLQRTVTWLSGETPFQHPSVRTGETNRLQTSGRASDNVRG
jgi:hypothetical protein